MNSVKPITIGILLVGLLFLLTRNGQAFVTPQHYERIKMQDREKTRGTEKVPPQAPVEIQVQQTNPGQPQTGKPGPKQPPGDRK